MSIAKFVNCNMKRFNEIIPDKNSRNQKHKSQSNVTAGIVPAVPTDTSVALKPNKDSGVSEVTTNPTETQLQPEEITLPSDEEGTEINSDDILRIREERPLLDQKCKQLPFWQDDVSDQQTSLVTPKTADKQIQTDVLLPIERNSGAVFAQKHVQVLQGMLMARRWALDREKCRRLGLDDLLRQEEPLVNVKQEILTLEATCEDFGLHENVCLDAGSKDVEIVDLMSSSQQADLLILPTPMDGVTVSFPCTQTYGGESLRYSLLHPCPEEPVAGAFRTVLNFVEDELLSNTQTAVDYFSGSFLESAVDTLLLTSDLEGSVSCQMLLAFCIKLLDIITCSGMNEGAICEHYSNMILKFCESAVVAFNLIDHLLRKLLELQRRMDEGDEVVRDNVYSLCYSFYILPILSTIFSAIEEKAKAGSIGEIMHGLSATSNKNSGVLNLWRRHWRPAEVDVAVTQSYAPTTKISLWMEKLETSLQTFIPRAPILVPSVTKCIEILRNLDSL